MISDLHRFIKKIKIQRPYFIVISEDSVEAEKLKAVLP